MTAIIAESLVSMAVACLLQPVADQYRASSSRSTIVFRQHELERRWSAFHADAIAAKFDAPADVLRACFESLPDRAKVYPTEGYYYFNAVLEDREISGNFRVSSEAGRPLLHFAYFDRDNPRHYHSLTLPHDDSAFELADLGDGRTGVILDGVSKVFEQQLRFRDSQGQVGLESDEVLIAGVLDESGVWFSLVFNTETNYFHYSLNADDPSGEVWTEESASAAGRVLIGRRTGFVLVEHASSGRRVLAGVRAGDIQRNTYYDGPFDQVPPDLDIGHYLRKAYPYVNAGEGIDQTGSFLGRDSVRVAISPYQTYVGRDRIVALCADALEEQPDLASMISRVCHESKRDLPASGASRPSSSAPRRWPANHFRTVSYSEDARPQPAGLSGE